ncbi:hypothetical protein KP001_08060 [Geomonas subterranea]|uniref:Lipoprotein n=1 Tax=Geomonas subterranea TaxID=2847989 RepID=A0ABX8LKE2_9BACT|nr:hypothetical protein [Geomonas subterranea]QXE92466.1 hypothetical protein KP001_08060 [Geomonas subterranea]QXM09435.1 hypothetical protein KP002_21210 [Geomonas subterranea]
MKRLMATLGVLVAAMMLSGCIVPYWSDDERGGYRDGGYRDGGYRDGGYRDGGRYDGRDRR